MMEARDLLSKQTIALLNENAKTEWQHGKFSDITFIVGKDKKEFPAIRGIFAMQCPYFATKLYSECDIAYGQKINEDDINITEAGFKFIHQLLYRLDPLITAQNVIDVLYAANKYSLPNLAADCNSFIDAIYKSTDYNTNIANILLFETRAIQLNLKVNHSLRQRFQNWLTVETSHQIIKSKAFLLAPKELIIEIIKNDSLSVKEEEIWIRCKEWCTYQIQTNYGESKLDVEQEMTWHVLMRENFVKQIRFGLIPKQFFVKHVYPSNVLSIEESMKIALHFMDSTTKIDYNVNHRHKVNYDLKTELKMMKSQLDIYKTAQVLQYTLEVSSKYKGIDNSYEGLTNNNVNVGVTTNNSTNEYVVANFARKQHVVRMDIGGFGNMSQQKWDVNHLNNRIIQYKNDSGNWMDWKVMTNLQQNVISVMDVDIKTNAIRIFDNAQRHISIGCWRFYGIDIDIDNIPILVSLTDHKDCSISVNWKLSENSVSKYNNNSKLKIEWNEWNETKSDDIDQFAIEKWEYKKEIHLNNNIDNKTININVENKNANYIFHIEYFDGHKWSISSNIKSISIKQQNNDQYRVFDEIFNCDGYFSLSNDGKLASFIKTTNVAGHGDYQYYPACKVSKPINSADIGSQTIKFKMFQYGWYGIGSKTVSPHGFPGYTNSGWMIRINNGGCWYDKCGISSNSTGNLTNKIVTIKYIPNTKQLIVIIPNGTQYTYTHKDMPSSGNAYFVFTMASGKVQLFD